jgi:hypothetical protein
MDDVLDKIPFTTALPEPLYPSSQLTGTESKVTPVILPAIALSECITSVAGAEDGVQVMVEKLLLP